MQKLSRERINELAGKLGVRSVAVKNFLGSMGDDEDNARANLNQDARAYRWNLATIAAIKAGINEACGRPTR